MRSNAGVGTTPPNEPAAPNPQSSVMITRTFGAPFGGTTRGGHHGFESVAFSLISPPNFGSGGGSCFPLIVVVALGEPGVPLISWACDCRAIDTTVIFVSSDEPTLRSPFFRLIAFLPLAIRIRR